MKLHIKVHSDTTQRRPTRAKVPAPESEEVDSVRAGGYLTVTQTKQVFDYEKEKHTIKVTRPWQETLNSWRKFCESSTQNLLAKFAQLFVYMI